MASAACIAADSLSLGPETFERSNVLPTNGQGIGRTSPIRYAHIPHIVFACIRSMIELVLARCLGRQHSPGR